MCLCTVEGWRRSGAEVGGHTQGGNAAGQDGYGECEEGGRVSPSGERVVDFPRVSS